MSARGKKSNCTIAGHTLTWAELTVLNQLRDYMRRFWNPAAVGKPLHEIFPGDSIGANAKRHCARHLSGA